MKTFLLLSWLCIGIITFWVKVVLSDCVIYMTSTSKYSITMVGAFPDRKGNSEDFRREAAITCEYLKNRHASGRLPYVQTKYPETQQRLSGLLSNNDDKMVSTKSTTSSTQTGRSKNCETLGNIVCFTTFLFN